ncbi:unnamed protein product [Diatraea saccharalis]|uniref:LRRCT domain-containing protein n=1 Tax=Diatraea saccharalis TaxID=40085 RepID=A0A9N9R2A5_9NEOP|nr:unnamed protein product [Diatraea saccharalis]
MLVYSMVFSLIIHSYSVRSVDVCASVNFCACRDNIDDNQDYLGDSVDCSYHFEGQNVLATNFSLPDVTFSLDLSSSNITHLHTSRLLQSTTLLELTLKNNILKEIPAKVLLLPALKWLDLSYNQLEYIDKEAFSDLRNVEHLNLANNRLVTFERLGFHHLRNLNELVLDNNNLGKGLLEANLFDRSGFGLTHKIKRLSIRGVNLNEVPDNFFSDAYDIRKLVISNNNLKEIFELPFTLEYLDLSDNPISDISNEDFIDLPGLKVLKLNNLLIREVPEYVFSALHGLVELELERNKNLTIFSPLAFGQDILDDADYFVLEKLSLRGSRLTALDQELAEPIGQLSILDLQGNPWTCDCNLLWLKSLQIPPEYYEHIRCGSPKPFYNCKVFELDAKYFSCSQISDHHVGLALAIVAFCIILAGIALWFFVFIPRYQSRGNCIANLHTPTATYTVLPVHSHRTEF